MAIYTRIYRHATIVRCLFSQKCLNHPASQGEVFFRNSHILPHHYKASQTRGSRLEFFFLFLFVESYKKINHFEHLLIDAKYILEK